MGGAASPPMALRLREGPVGGLCGREWTTDSWHDGARLIRALRASRATRQRAGLCGLGS